MKLIAQGLILSLFFTFVQAEAQNLCEAIFLEQNKEKVSVELQKWVRAAPTNAVATHFGYSLSVAERILKHQPKTYIEMAKVLLGKKSKYKEGDLKAVYLYRGMVLHPKDYDPLFENNSFGGNTKPGRNWFSEDSSTAHSYATPEREYILENKPKDQKTLPVGIRIAVEIPRFLLEEAMVDSFRNKINVALDRRYFPNESLYISSVLVIIADYQTKELKEVDLDYDKFLQKYLKRSKFKDSFLF